ncbi:unnamed protein product [Ceratitis capitata]|uniref:(Mediterranean fruit fly) hypothetical protein n=1 Tax=Ceratitis capitata TaxID=7213 RepID=A0A811V7A5_CERCA|nr:unnamed protein product [Ceratitis capitata]
MVDSTTLLLSFIFIFFSSLNNCLKIANSVRTHEYLTIKRAKSISKFNFPTMLFVRIFLVLVLLSMANAFFFNPAISKPGKQPTIIRKPHRRIKINIVRKRRSTTTTSTTSTTSTTTSTTTPTTTTSTTTSTTTPTTTTSTTTPATTIIS